MYKVAVLASTNGTDFQAMIEAKRAGTLRVELACLITNVSNCGAVEKAEAAGIPVHFVDPQEKSREDYDREVMKVLEPYALDLVVLVGYMRILGAELVQRYQNRILNVHPSLLPKFAGGMNLDVHRAVLEAGEKETGMTIHLVTDQVDAGPIVCQKRVAVSPEDTPETLKTKVQALEKEWFPKTIQLFADSVFWQKNSRRNLWQHPLWGQFQEAIGRPTFWVQTKGAQALAIKRGLPFGLNWLEVPRGPLFESENDLGEILAELKKLGQTQGSVFIRMSSFDPKIAEVPGLKIRHYDNHPQTSLVLDLSASEEDLLEQMKPKGRYNIKVAQKHNVTVAPSRDVAAFFNILQFTGERDGFKLHSQSYYQTLLESLGTNAQLLIAHYEERPVAGGIFVHLDDWAIYYYGASDYHYRNTMAPYLLQWEAIREAKRRGCKFYDFLGIAPQGSLRHRWAGVTEFKLKFGGRVLNFPQSRELVLRQGWYFLYRIYKRLRA